LFEIIQILHKKIELDHIVGTGKKVNRKKSKEASSKVQGCIKIGSEVQGSPFRVTFEP
jgi:hypothetical protein